MLAVLLLAAAAPAPRNLASGSFELPQRQIWAGEMFDMALVWRVNWETFGNLEGPLEWEAGSIVAEPFSEPVLQQNGGTARIILSTRAMALAPGELRIAPAHQSMVLRTGTLNAGDMPIAITESRPVSSDPAKLVVRPLPPAPRGFIGAVGRFTLAASAEPLSPKAGERVTWRLTLSGDGNWPMIHALPQRLVSRDFDVVGKPEAKAESGTSPFNGTLSETVTLIPRVVGQQRLGPVEMAVFDPKTGTYLTVKAPEILLDVQPGPGARPPAKIEEPVSFPPPVRGEGAVLQPVSPLLWRTSLLAPPIIIALAWFGVIWARAVLRDPGRPLRVAARRLRKWTDIRNWQSAFAARHGITDAAPTRDAFVDPAASALWHDSETALYAPGTPALPDDWRARMEQYVASLGPPPKFDVRQVFRREALLPVLALCLIGAAPTDWKASYTQARTAMLAGKEAKAAPDAAAAWLQHPSAETAALWTLAAEKSGAPTDLGGVSLPPEGWRRLFGTLSSPAWQRLLISSIAMGTAGLILLLAALYGFASRSARLISGVVIALGALGAGVSAGAIAYYGPAGRAQGAILSTAAPLRPLPVDTPDTGLPVAQAGMAVTADKAFLGWRHIRLADGQDGWVPATMLRHVWLTSD